MSVLVTLGNTTITSGKFFAFFLAAQFFSAPLNSDFYALFILKQYNSHGFSRFQFYDALEMLLTVKNYTTKMAVRINSATSERNDISKSLGRFTYTGLDDHLLWTRDTWYTPHRDAQCSTIPHHLFGHGNKKTTETVLPNEDVEEEDTLPVVRELSDEFGYQKTESGWFNVYTKKVTDRHPLYDEEN
ncbi:hypothetical protein K492DRAFT_186970 [Lichtheimia hyalospora FSU 10163]|nr:hypothetical protein K492DRAFT_186970 [Lichtheimia hyalospora FSU 10163]